MKPLATLPLLALVLSASPALGAADPPIFPESMEATSGTGAGALLDGNRETGWTPVADPEDEGVLFRFSPPLAVDGVRVVACPGSPSFAVQAFANGRRAGRALPVEPGAMAFLTFPSPFKADSRETVRLTELFVRIDDAAGLPCVGEIVFERAGATVDVAAPRKIYAKASASSELEPHAARNAFDGKPQTSWMESAKGTGEGQWIELTLSAPVTATGLELWSGRQGSKTAYSQNPRPRKITVAAGEAKPFALAAKDRIESQRLDFPEAVTSSSFRFSIASTFPGNKKKDLAISDIALMGEEGAVVVSFEDPAAAPKTIDLPVVGRHRVSFCAREDGTRRRLKLRATGTFAAWDESESGAVRSMLGTWKPQAGASPWTTLAVSAESRSTEPGSDRNATKNLDTKIEIARVADLGPDGFRAAVATLSNPAAVACITKEGDEAFRLLVEGDAILVKGAGLDDILWRTRR